MKQASESEPLMADASQKGRYDGKEEAEEPRTELSSSFVAPSGRQVFPLELFNWCDRLVPGLSEILPRQIRRVQNVPHLVLLVGVFMCAWLLVSNFSAVASKGQCRTKYCEGLILTVIFEGCCVMYFVQTIKQYDEDLLVKQKEIQMAKDELAKNYQATVSELDLCIAKSMDTQATLAERTFDAKRRDFQRFLTKAAKDSQRAEAGKGGDASHAEFRRFVGLWFRVFEECSIDPVQRPLRIVTIEELAKCASAPKVAELSAERLKASQVKFISKQLDDDKKELTLFRSVWKKMSNVHKKALNIKRKSVAAGVLPTKDQEQGTMSFDQGALPKDEPKDSFSRRWFQPGRSDRLFGLEEPELEQGDQFPIVMHILRCKCTLLSLDHLQLMVSFVIGWVLLYIEVARVYQFRLSQVCSVITCLICLAFVLYEFIDIDIVQQLEMQLKDVEQEQAKLEAKRKAMLGFYDRAQHLAEIWLHRTVPRLELLKQFSEELEDLMSGEFAPFLQDANSKMEALEQSLPALPLWLAEGEMDEKTKQLLGNAMTQLTRTSDVKASLAMMPKCCKTLAEESNRLAPATKPAAEVTEP